MKTKKYFLCLLSLVCGVLFVSCGITEELDASNQTIESLNTSLVAQEKNYQQLATLSDEMLNLLSESLEDNKEAMAYQDKEGTYYENHQAREELLTEMKKTNKKIGTDMDKLQKIAKKKAVDVPISDLKKISQSLTVIDKNFEAVAIFVNTTLEQEDELFDNLIDEESITVEEDTHSIRQVYGSLYLLLEESPANIEYAVSLTDQFLETYVKK